MSNKKIKAVSANPLDHNHEGLPLPRLQLRWEMEGDTWERRTCTYELVLPLCKSDIRAERAYSEDGPRHIGQASVLRLKICSTTVTGGGYPVREGVVDTPFRDSAHARWDARCLNLPVFATCGSQATKV